MGQYLRFPHKVLTDLETVICEDMGLFMQQAVSAHVAFMRKRGLVSNSDDEERVVQAYLDQHLANHQQLLDKYLVSIPKYLKTFSLDEFRQAWTLMGGVWNTVEYERTLPIVQIQRRYPVLLAAAKRIGRVPDDQSKEQAPVSIGGGKLSIEHSSPSDIAGVSVGNDIRSMLPFEMAMMTDDTLDGLFAYRFAERQLQTFQYRSNLAKTARKAEVRQARQDGPMVVCLDTSGSMMGEPNKIAMSMIVKLLEIAIHNNRDLLLLTFAGGVTCYDLRRDRTRILDMLRHEKGGDTNGIAMLRAVFQRLSTDRYAASDVLMISDFKFAAPTGSDRRQLMQLQDEGTKFYGLEIGTAQARDWKALLNYYWHVEYKVPLRPWFVMK